MNVNEYGVDFLMSTSYDMSGFTSLSLEFTKPDDTTLVVTDPAVSVPASPVATTAGTFAANQYISYTFQIGDVDQTGEWSARLTYVDGSKRLISEIALFTVDP